MVLEALGQSISSALAGLSQVSTIDDEVLNSVLKEIARALMMADVNVRIVGQLRDNIKKRVNVEKLAAGLNKEKIIHQAVHDELVAILDSGVEEGRCPKGLYEPPLSFPNHLTDPTTQTETDRRQYGQPVTEGNVRWWAGEASEHRGRRSRRG